MSYATRNWCKRVTHELIKKLGGQISKFDKAYFLWHHKDGTVSDIIDLHVDDFIYCGANEWLLNVVETLKKIFKINKTVNGCFKYLGLNVVQTNNAIYVDHDVYIDELKYVKLKPDRASQKDELLSKEEIKAVRAIAGQLLWISSNTRPDIAFDSCAASNYGKSPTIKCILTANKTVDRVKRTGLKLVFLDLGNPDLWKVRVYSDASHANLSTGASQGGFIVFIEGNGRVSPIVW